MNGGPSSTARSAIVTIRGWLALGSRVRTCSAMSRGFLSAPAHLGDALDDGAEIADRDALGEQELQHALDAGRRDLARHDLLDEIGMILGQFLQELLHLDMREQLGHVAP